MLSSAEDRIVNFSPPEVPPGAGHLQTLAEFFVMDLVGKCLGTAVTAVRPIIGICIPMMSKEEGFYLQEMHASYQCTSPNKD